ncbi:DUF3899 domain-containing protein [Mycoplasmopsis synoviae]|uniref:DUF3899 domain-containing protein n=1 Tax=Mycoplasmopsis synoviae TaxID=2109 RepID=UPI000367191E|nr:DUF3899 domain-containing protein [Mycoplasmopsis synoviae]AKB11082.1 hypothetical protein VY93_01870 [Mycoplasmopsis synoviae ATCC 25204]
MWKKLSLYLKREIKSKYFILVFLTYLICYALALGFFLLINEFSLKQKNSLIDVFTTVSVIFTAVLLLILIFRFGFLKNLFTFFKKNHENTKKLRQEYKSKKLSYEEKQAYKYLNQQKEAKKPKVKTSNFPFVFIALLSLIITIIVAIISFNL